MSEATGTETVATMIWLRDTLASGRGLELVQAAGLTFRDVAEVCGVSIPSAWCYLHGRIERPRRTPGLRLARLLRQLEVLDASR